MYTTLELVARIAATSIALAALLFCLLASERVWQTVSQFVNTLNAF